MTVSCGTSPCLSIEPFVCPLSPFLFIPSAILFVQGANLVFLPSTIIMWGGQKTSLLVPLFLSLSFCILKIFGWSFREFELTMEKK